MKYFEFTLITIGFGILSIFLIYIDAFEILYEFSRDHEDLEIDDIAIILISFVVCAVIYLSRRTQKQNLELRSRNRELEAARARADRANRAKSDFLSSMSHELRTPMNAILGFAQLLVMDDSIKHEKSNLVSAEQILASGDHLLNLVNQVLNLSRIESGDVDMNYDWFQLPEIVDECVPLVQALAEQRNIAIVKAFDEGSYPPAYTDGSKIKQIVINLLTNSIKYNVEDGSIFVDIRKLTDSYLRVSVRDTGVGISDKLRERVFQPFERLGHENSTTDGTGIGLTICKQLIELMGGRINFKSTAGEGSTFWVDIPLTGQTRAASLSN